MARDLNEDCVILPIIVTQDAAQVDGNGRKSLTPMYATFGVIRSAERNMEWARVLIGYIPHPNKNKRPRDRFDTDWKRYKKKRFQARDEVHARRHPRVLHNGGAHGAPRARRGAERDDSHTCHCVRLVRQPGDAQGDGCQGLLQRKSGHVHHVSPP